MAGELPSIFSCGLIGAIQSPNGKLLKARDRARREVAMSSQIREVPISLHVQADFR
jgi:hypothetical protein